MFCRKKVLYYIPHLKVLSSEMDPAELGSFDRTLLKESLRRGVSKIRPSPNDWDPFNSRAPSRTVIGH